MSQAKLKLKEYLQKEREIKTAFAINKQKEHRQMRYNSEHQSPAKKNSGMEFSGSQTYSQTREKPHYEKPAV